MSQQGQINLKEKTVDELKVYAWDLRTTIDVYNQAYQSVVTELNSRLAPQTPAQESVAETETVPA